MCLCYGARLSLHLNHPNPTKGLETIHAQYWVGLFAITVGDVDAAETISLTGAS